MPNFDDEEGNEEDDEDVAATIKRRGYTEIHCHSEMVVVDHDKKSIVYRGSVYSILAAKSIIAIFKNALDMLEE
jgi:hypothetical protein